MKKLFFAIAVILLTARTKEESFQNNDNVSSTPAPVVVAKSGRLKFNSTYELSQVVDMLKVSDIYKINVTQIPNITRSGEGEEKSTNQGRDVVRWDKQWFSGNFSLSFKTNLNNNWSIKPGNISSNRVDFNRGKIYGAVKYNNQWRACVIETK